MLTEVEALDIIQECLKLHGYYLERRHYRIRHDSPEEFIVEFCPHKIHRVFDIDIIYEMIGKANIKDFKMRMDHDKRRVSIILKLNIKEE